MFNSEQLRATIIATELSVAIKMIASARCSLPSKSDEQALAVLEDELIEFRNEYMRKERIG